MTVEVENLEFDGLIMALQNGSIDAAIAGMSVTPDRVEQVDFTETYYDAGLNIAVAIDDDSIASEEDLAGKVVTAQQGTTAVSYTHLFGGTSVDDIPHFIAMGFVISPSFTEWVQ